MRISLTDARKLGIKIPGEKAKRKTTPAVKDADGKPVTGKAKTRLRLADYGRSSLKFEIDLPADPQPKERPRTVINMGALISAFVEARGSVAKFKQLIGRGSDDNAPAGEKKKRPSISHTYTPKNTADYEDLILKHATVAMANAGLKPFECPVKTHVHLVFEGDPETWPTSPGDGDADNLEKAVLDALNNVVYIDDRLVVRSIRTKSCGPKPRLIVKVSPVSRGASAVRRLSSSSALG
jgi:Holliday junction resolvase RusA-like endonuclease